MFLRLPEAALSPFHSYRLSLVGEAISNLLLGFQPSRASLCSLGVGVSTFHLSSATAPAPSTPSHLEERLGSHLGLGLCWPRAPLQG